MQRTGESGHAPGCAGFLFEAPIRIRPSRLPDQVAVELLADPFALDDPRPVTGGPALGWTGPGCCDLHNRNCEPPSELCCSGCAEAAHDTFPVPHADGSGCVLGISP